MESFEEYIGDVVELTLQDKRSQSNLSILLNKMKNEKSLQIWKLSTDKKEYDRFEYLLSKHQDTNGINPSDFNALLLKKGKQSLEGEVTATIIHDPCYIRKEHSKELENLDRVRNLDGKMINGYRSFNSVLLDTDSLHLLGCIPYSQKEGSKLDDGHFTNKEVSFGQIRQISASLKEDIPSRTLIHIMDREADDVEYFKLIDKELDDKFIFRLKSNRNSDVEYLFEKRNEQGHLIKESLRFVKIHKKILSNRFERIFERFVYKGKCYREARANVSYERIWVGDDYYWIVKIEVKTRTGRAIFAKPMVLISNIPIITDDVAVFIYQKYLKRSKIEGVFKFLKEELGWEDFRVRDFIAIKNIILLGFFVGAYFCEREPELIHNPFVILICDLARSKGKVTKHFFMLGLKKMAQYQMTVQFFEENQLSKDDIEQLLKLLK